VQPTDPADLDRTDSGDLGYLTDLIREALELQPDDDVPVDEPLVDLGVDSLLAVELGDRIYDDLGVVLSAEIFNERPDLRILAGMISSRRSAAGVPAVDLAAVDLAAVDLAAGGG
jgi:acyl carrier protein